MVNDRLNRREDEVMGAVFALSGGKERLLVSPLEILSLLPKRNLSEEKLDAILRELELDGYFDLTPSDRKGERMYVIHLRSEGLDYRRSAVRRKRTLIYRLVLAGICAVISFFVGLLLKSIFR